LVKIVLPEQALLLKAAIFPDDINLLLFFLKFTLQIFQLDSQLALFFLCKVYLRLESGLLILFKGELVRHSQQVLTEPLVLRSQLNEYLKK